MLGNTYVKQNCSAARALEIVGERWSLLILRDALFRGMTRFSEFERSLGVAPNILTKRLEGFVAAGLFEQKPADDGSDTLHYFPTEKGLDLKPVIMALTAWGDRWAAPNGPPVSFKHEVCKGRVAIEIRCVRCGTIPKYEQVLAVPTGTARSIFRLPPRA
jgi:DNA-binding HxlR family transcriptional regulator